MPNNLDGYAVLITGGTTGLGLSHAQVLGRRGAKVAITDFNEATASRRSASRRTIASSPK
jgi:NAD(P)-dependent dehydrogenase (short-subunit alcohol dehydrogenase family)